MKQAMIRVAFFWLAIFILIQPMLSSIDYFLDLHVRSTTAYIAEKAAPEGMVTSSLRQEAIDMLTAVGFKESDIEITYMNTFHERGERLEVSIRVPREILFLYNFANTSPSHYYAKNAVMSEWIE